ncbi:MAG: hypothetical protein N3A54_04670, partial [Patescibacteria group bacterium]|nr:hypothetical protein [Patescibacteria group bacterium]
VHEPSDEDTHDILGTQDIPTPTLEKSPQSLERHTASRFSQSRYRNIAISLFFIGSGFGLLSLVLYGKRLFQRFKSP